MATFTDFIGLQHDFAHMLLCDDFLATVNIVTRKRLLLDADQRLPDKNMAAESLVYVTPRNKKHGVGVIVERPQMGVKPEFLGVPGPQGAIVLECLVIEDEMTNLGPTSGTGIAADQVGQRIVDLAHLWVCEGQGTYHAGNAVMQEAKDWQPLSAYRVTMILDCNRGQTERVGRVGITLGDTTVTLSCGTAGAAIYYSTQAGKFPGPSDGATLYGAPFAKPAAGTVIRAAAYKGGLIQSPMARKVVS